METERVVNKGEKSSQRTTQTKRKMAETSQPIHATDDKAAQTEAFSTLWFYLTESLSVFYAEMCLLWFLHRCQGYIKARMKSEEKRRTRFHSGHGTSYNVSGSNMMMMILGWLLHVLVQLVEMWFSHGVRKHIFNLIWEMFKTHFSDTGWKIFYVLVVRVTSSHPGLTASHTIMDRDEFFLTTVPFQ